MTDASSPNEFMPSKPIMSEDVKMESTKADSHVSSSEDRATRAQLENRVLRKLDLNVLPILFGLYLLSILDRSNIGNAKVAGMDKDLHLDNYHYTWLLTIFYITYVLGEPAVLLWKRFPAHIVSSTPVFGWGVVAAAQAAAQNWGGMMALRFLLGAFEAAASPGFVFYLSLFYLRREIGFRCGIYVSAAPLASTFGGALAYGITNGHSRLAPWRLLFLVEGLPTILMAGVCFFFIPDTPEKSKFLDEEEKEITRERVHRQVGSSAEERIGKIVWSDVLHILVDARAWVCFLMYFCASLTFSSLPVFLPTIIKDMGFTAINAQGLSAPPSFAAFLFTLITTWIADRTSQRCLVILATSLTGAIGYLLLAVVETVGVRYFATFLASAGVFSTLANTVGMTLNKSVLLDSMTNQLTIWKATQGSDTRRGLAVIGIQAIGNCGPFLGTNVFPASESPRYVRGMSICAAFTFFLSVLAVTQRWLLVRENAKLDEKYGSIQDHDGDDDIGVENYGPRFRYCL